MIPSSALSLFFRRVVEGEPLSFQLLHEGEGRVIGEAVMERQGNVVQVSIGGEAGNRFVEEDGVVVEFGWGGETKSRLVADKETAVAGTAWA